MVEFGEKVKQLREEKGMTQQTMADMLYVTRQAVSRWECGARYPDLLTAKKIAQILEVTVDELLSGEELKENIEKEPVLAQPVENIIQSVLYTVAVIAYLLMCIFSFYSVFMPNEALAHTPAGKITLLTINTLLGHVVSFVAAMTGLTLSVRKRLTAKMTGYIMCVPYVLAAFSFLVTYVDMQMKQNGRLTIGAWVTDFMMPLVFAACILLFFERNERNMPCEIIFLLCLLTGGYIAAHIRHRLGITTDLGFVVSTVHCLGKMGMAVLLGYQAYIWNRKKRIAYKT